MRTTSKPAEKRSRNSCLRDGNYENRFLRIQPGGACLPPYRCESTHALDTADPRRSKLQTFVYVITSSELGANVGPEFRGSQLLHDYGHCEWQRNDLATRGRLDGDGIAAGSRHDMWCGWCLRVAVTGASSHSN